MAIILVKYVPAKRKKKQIYSQKDTVCCVLHFWLDVS